MPPASAKTLALSTIALNQMAGGLEKNIVNLANAMSRRGYTVHLITFDQPGAVSFYPLDESVRWHMVGATKPHAAISFLDRLKLIVNIRRILKSFDPKTPLICFHHGILARFFLASIFLRHPIICSERNSLSLYNHVRQKRWNLNFFLMEFCKKITVQFPRYIQNYPARWRARMMSIGNPVFPVSHLAKPAAPDAQGRYKILSISRIEYPKNIDVLVRAFALLEKQYPEWDLHILGEGVEKPMIEALLRTKNLQNRAFLHGKRSDVVSYFLQSHIFCLPSLWEGFPNAAAEALAHGLPCVGFASCDGMRDLIAPEKNGLLADTANDPATLAKTLKILMDSPEKRELYGRRAQAITSDYAPEKIYDQWEKLMEML